MDEQTTTTGQERQESPQYLRMSLAAAMGKITSWKDLGGEGPVVVVSRDTSSGTYETWEHLVMVLKGERSRGPITDMVLKSKL